MLSLLPTDTCYGLAGELTREDYDEIYRLKWRDFSKPLAILVRDYADMEKYIDISLGQKEFLKNYPYPWSFLGKRTDTYILPEYMEKDMYAKISLRVAENCINANIRDIISYPLFLTSANLSGSTESSVLQVAQTFFPMLWGIDGWVCMGKPSDIFSLSVSGEIIYLRKNYA